MQKYEIDTKNTNYKKYRCPEEEDRRLNASLSPVLSSFVPIFSASLLPHCRLTQPPLLIHQRHSMPGPGTTFRPDLSTDAVFFCTLVAPTALKICLFVKIPSRCVTVFAQCSLNRWFFVFLLSAQCSLNCCVFVFLVSA